MSNEKFSILINFELDAIDSANKYNENLQFIDQIESLTNFIYYDNKLQVVNNKNKKSNEKFIVLTGQKLKLKKTLKEKPKLTSKEQLIQQLLSSSQGRHRLAAAMASPIRTTLDYQGFARRAFSVQELPEGALPVFDRNDT